MKRSGDRARYVVSCQHVLSPGHDLDDGFANAAVSLLDGDGTTIATAVPIRGQLGDVARYSLDAQLARIVEGTDVDTALGAPVIEGYARHEDDALLAAKLYVHTPRGVIAADVNAMPGEEMVIPYGGVGGNVRHERLIELQTERPTHGGDSGSPVFSRRNGGLLMGMLIAGPPDNTPERPGSLSHAIPAAHLLDPERYMGALGETWRL